MMIEAVISMARYLSSRKDDDVVDRMNYLYTPNMLLAFSVLISFKQFGGRPLECVLPSKFPGSWEQYAENYCWSQDSYFVAPDVDVELIREQERYSEVRRLSYYQWVPFFLLLQAACFRLPSFLWKCASMNSGIQVHEIVERACDSQNMEESHRKKNIDTLTAHITKALKFQRRVAKRNIVLSELMKVFNVRYKACFISYMYLVMKVLYLVNVFAQFYLMNWFLRTSRNSLYGMQVILDIINGVEWESSGYFPRVSICDFTIRQVANIQKYSVQCVLVINIFNEKIFILLWFWYVLLIAASLISMAYWTIIILFSCFGHHFIKSNLALSDLEVNSKTSKKEVATFVNDYLKQDGIFVVRMVSLHAGLIFGTELIAELYKTFHGIADDEKIHPVPNYLDANRDDYLLRKRKKSLNYGSDDEGGTFLLPTAPTAGNDPKVEKDESASSKSTGRDDDDDDDRRSKKSDLKNNLYV
uniref:Innexin n=1 Tax=Panagrellus redivivus TaxID=6233 RepID=A0A7E4W944_PANRE